MSTTQVEEACDLCGVLHGSKGQDILGCCNDHIGHCKRHKTFSFAVRILRQGCKCQSADRTSVAATQTHPVNSPYPPLQPQFNPPTRLFASLTYLLPLQLRRNSRMQPRHLLSKHILHSSTIMPKDFLIAQVWHWSISARRPGGRWDGMWQRICIRHARRRRDWTKYWA